MSVGSYIERPNKTLRVYAIAFLVVLYLPILATPLFSVNDSIYVRFPLQGLTIQWYIDLWSHTAVLTALGNSVKVGIVVAIASTALGLLTALAITRYRIPGQNAIVGFSMMPLVVPGIIFGVALLIVFSRLGVPLSLLTVGLGHMVICLTFAVATLLARFEGFDRSIEEASSDLGENGWWTF